MSSADAATRFLPIRAGRLPEQVARQVQEAIFRGDYVPGHRLPTERELMQQFGTSRATVREALRALERAGLVQVRPGAGGGTYVAEPTSRLLSDSLQQLLQLKQFRVAELHQARLVLEPSLAFLAAESAMPADLAALEETLEKARQLIKRRQEASAASRRFHLLVAQASGNKLLAMLDQALLELAGAYDAARAWTTKAAQAVLAEHAAILGAVRDHEPERAEMLMRAHLRELLAHPPVGGH